MVLADGCRRMAGRRRAAAGRAALALERREARELEFKREGEEHEGVGRGGYIRDQALPVQKSCVARDVRCSGERVQQGGAVRRVQVDTVKNWGGGRRAI